MKVTLEKHGGFAATLRRAPRVVDSTTLAQPAAEELARLVAAARAAPASKANEMARDAIQYTIAVTDEGQTTVLSQGDTSMSIPFAALKAWLERQPEANRADHS
jgi:hypothetical protein